MSFDKRIHLWGHHQQSRYKIFISPPKFPLFPFVVFSPCLKVLGNPRLTLYLNRVVLPIPEFDINSAL